MKHIPSFGKALRAMRHAKGLSQDGLGITQTNISKLELGKKVPSWERVGDIADHLNIHPLTLFTLSYLAGPRGAEVDALLRLVRSEIQEFQSSQQVGVGSEIDLN